jgi:hypothetical protein
MLRVTFQQADIVTTDFSEATVLTLYLSSSIKLKLRPTPLNMQSDRLIESESGNTRGVFGSCRRT